MKTPPIGYTTHGIVTEVIDGDTLEVEVKKRMRIRLLECWAPESRTTNKEEKRRGIAAKNNLVRLARGQDVIVHIPGSDDLREISTLSRALGYVWFVGSDESLNELQVAAGHATATKETR